MSLFCNTIFKEKSLLFLLFLITYTPSCWAGYECDFGTIVADTHIGGGLRKLKVLDDSWEDGYRYDYFEDEDPSLNGNVNNDGIYYEARGFHKGIHRHLFRCYVMSEHLPARNKGYVIGIKDRGSREISRFEPFKIEKKAAAENKS